MAILDTLFGKKDETVTDVTVEQTTTVDKKVTKKSAVQSDLAMETAITGKTEAVIYSTGK